jgi:hypothetical protein
MNVCGVLRSVGERTTEQSRQILGEQLGRIDQVVTVGHKPFPETLADGLRAGLASGRAWTLCVDADVLPLPGAVAALLDEAAMLDQTAAELQPLVFDRFFGGWRFAGVHLYRTRYLPKALAILETLPTSIRPETALLRQLVDQGLGWHLCSVEFGLHDFEQSARDVYRKCFVHARKHDYLGPQLVRYWSARAADAADFTVALAGMTAGTAHLGDVALDANAPYLIAADDTAIRQAPPLDGLDPSAILEAEQRTLTSLPRDVAPVHDWLETAAASAVPRRRSIDAFIRAVLEHTVGPFAVDGADARTSLFLQSARAWGLPVRCVIAEATPQAATFRAVPIVTADGANEPRLIRIGRGDDGRFVTVLAGTRVMEPRRDELRTSTASSEPPIAIDALVQRLSAARPERMIVYGAGEYGVQIATACRKIGCQTVAFIESDPAAAAALSVPALAPEAALEQYPDTDVVVASLSSAVAMLRRLFSAVGATQAWPRRIWLLGAP